MSLRATGFFRIKDQGTAWSPCLCESRRGRSRRLGEPETSSDDPARHLGHLIVHTLSEVKLLVPIQKSVNRHSPAGWPINVPSNGLHIRLRSPRSQRTFFFQFSRPLGRHQTLNSKQTQIAKSQTQRLKRQNPSSILPLEKGEVGRLALRFPTPLTDHPEGPGPFRAIQPLAGGVGIQARGAERGVTLFQFFPWEGKRRGGSR